MEQVLAQPQVMLKKVLPLGRHKQQIQGLLVAQLLEQVIHQEIPSGIPREQTQRVQQHGLNLQTMVIDHNQ